jgi:hypothetical protein
MSLVARAFFLLLFPLVAALDAGATNSGGNRDFAGLVDIGGGRKIYLECRGAGSPTVVLIAGKGNGAADWSKILDPADPVYKAPLDAVSAGEGHELESEVAVLPAVSALRAFARMTGQGRDLRAPTYPRRSRSRIGLIRMSMPSGRYSPPQASADHMSLFPIRMAGLLLCSMRGSIPSRSPVSSWSTPPASSSARRPAPKN